MSLRLIHFADLHLGMENYGRIDPKTGLHTRIQDFVKSLTFLCDFAIDQRVDLVVFAGDAYKSCDPNPTHQREFARQIRRFQQVGIPLVMVVGNHDAPIAFGKATSIDIFSTLELPATHVIRHPSQLLVETAGGPVQIAGMPWPTRHILRANDSFKDLSQEEITAQIERICSDQIEEFARRLDPEIPAILTAHIAAAEAIYSGSERSAIIGGDPALLTGALANRAFAYVALGHIHKHQDLNQAGSPPVVYSGSLDRINFGEEREDKGFCLVEIDANANGPGAHEVSYEFIPSPARPFVTVVADVSGNSDPTTPVVAAIDAADVSNAVVRVQYTADPDHASSLDLGRIRGALAEAHCVASIQPLFEPRVRNRRCSITADLGLREALDRYIDNNPGLGDFREILQQHAREIGQDLEAQDREEAGV